MYVYKITNNINNKVYIGITNNYKKRWSNEKNNPKNPKNQQVITQAIAKYGKDNFTFELLFSNLTIEEACQKEQELIFEYDCLIPKGYNVDKGGKYHPNRPPQFGEKNGRSLLTDEEALYIKDNRDKPMYILYEEFSDKISYESFKKCYKHQTYTHLPITKPEYPYNNEFSNQFKENGLEYDDIIEIRTRYNNGEYWKNVYKDYKKFFTNEMSFWRLYSGHSYKLVMPEVFTEENKQYYIYQNSLGSNGASSAFTEEEVIIIRRRYVNESAKEIYKDYSDRVSYQTFQAMLWGRSYKNLPIYKKQERKWINI